jgi:Fic family protein
MAEPEPDRYEDCIERPTPDERLLCVARKLDHDMATLHGDVKDARRQMQDVIDTHNDLLRNVRDVMEKNVTLVESSEAIRANAATKDDLAGIRERMATKDDVQAILNEIREKK